MFILPAHFLEKFVVDRQCAWIGVQIELEEKGSCSQIEQWCPSWKDIEEVQISGTYTKFWGVLPKEEWCNLSTYNQITISRHQSSSTVTAQWFLLKFSLMIQQKISPLVCSRWPLRHFREAVADLSTHLPIMMEYLHNSINVPGLKHSFLSPRKMEINSRSKRSGRYHHVGSLCERVWTDPCWQIFLALSPLYGLPILTHCPNQENTRLRLSRLSVFFLNLRECSKERSLVVQRGRLCPPAGSAFSALVTIAIVVFAFICKVAPWAPFLL